MAVNWFMGVHQTCTALSDLGYRRIGFVIGAHFDQMLRHQLLAAVACENLVGYAETIESLLYLPASNDISSNYFSRSFLELTRTGRMGARTRPLKTLAESLPEWFEQTRPDVIVFDREQTLLEAAARLNLTPPTPVGMTTLLCEPRSKFAGIEHRPDVVGATVVEVLNQKIMRGETGVSDNPTVQIIGGRWTQRPSVLPQPKTR